MCFHSILCVSVKIDIKYVENVEFCGVIDVDFNYVCVSCNKLVNDKFVDQIIAIC